MAKKKLRKTKKNPGGRPKVRDGDEVMLNFEMPLDKYALFTAYVSMRRQNAVDDGYQAASVNKRVIMIEAWDEFWKSLSSGEKRKVKNSDVYKQSLKRGNLRLSAIASR